MNFYNIVILLAFCALSYAAQHEDNSFEHAGLKNVKPGQPVSNTMTKVKVIGEAYSPIPVADKTMKYRPVILNADGTEWNKPAPKPMIMMGPNGEKLLVTPLKPEDKKELFYQKLAETNQPAVFNSPKTITTSVPPVDMPLMSSAFNHNPSSSAFKREIKAEIAKYLRLIVLAREKKNIADLHLYQSLLNKILRTLKASGVMTKTVRKVEASLSKISLEKESVDIPSTPIPPPPTVPVPSPVPEPTTLPTPEPIKEEKSVDPAPTNVDVPTPVPTSVDNNKEEFATKKYVDTRFAEVEKDIVKINKNIDEMTQRFNKLSDKEHKLTLATKNAISQLTKRIPLLKKR